MGNNISNKLLNRFDFNPSNFSRNIFCTSSHIFVVGNFGAAHQSLCQTHHNSKFLQLLIWACMEIYNIFLNIFLQKNNQWLIALLFLIRVIVLGPIFFFCRTSPKIHSPLWFPHDWQYVTIVIITSSVNNYFMAISFLSIPK